jgi:hypothetical protein
MQKESLIMKKLKILMDAVLWKSRHFRKDCIGFMKWLNKKVTDVITFIDESLYVD